MTDFSSMQLRCAHAIMMLPNNMGSAGDIAHAIGKNVQQIAVTSAMQALIRKDNTRPYEQSKWVIRLTPKDQYAVAWYALTNAFKEHLGYSLVNGKWRIDNRK